MAVAFSTIVVTSLIAVVCYRIIVFIFARRRTFQIFAAASIPGPTPSFITGNWRQLMNGTPHETLDRWTRNYGTTFGYFLGTIPTLVLSDRADIDEVLVKQAAKFPNRQRAIIKFEPFNSALIQRRGDSWRRSRRILSPAFTAHKMTLDTTTSVINDSVRRFLDVINRSALPHFDFEKFNLSMAMKCFSLDIITRLAFNMTPDDMYDERCELRELTIEFLEHSSQAPVAVVACFPAMEAIFRLLGAIFDIGRITTMILRHLRKCIDEYRCLSENKVNILDFMLEQRRRGTIDDLEVMGNAILVLLAGYETSALSQTFTLYLLAKNVAIQDRLRSELRELKDKYADQNNADDFCFFDRHRCPLLDRVWFEALRLYPIGVNFVTRKLDDAMPEIILKSGVRIPRDVTVQIPVRSVHNNPHYWPNPYNFDPTRANLPENFAINNPTYLPFGVGPRNCIGRFLAQSEARAVISTLLLRFKIEIFDSDDVDLEPETGLRRTIFHSGVIHPATDIRLRLVPLN